MRPLFGLLILCCGSCSSNTSPKKTSGSSDIITAAVNPAMITQVSEKDAFFRASKKALNKPVSPNYYVGKGSAYLDAKWSVGGKTVELLVVKQVLRSAELLQAHPQNNDADLLQLARLVHCGVKIDGKEISPEITSPVFKNPFGDGFTLYNPWLDYVPMNSWDEEMRGGCTALVEKEGDGVLLVLNGGDETEHYRLYFLFDDGKVTRWEARDYHRFDGSVNVVYLNIYPNLQMKPLALPPSLRSNYIFIPAH